MALLAAHSNACVKVSGFWAVDREWRADRIAPWVKETFALFGPKRCMFGSNLPIEKLMCPLPRQVEILVDILSANRQPTVMISSWRMRRASIGLAEQELSRGR